MSAARVVDARQHGINLGAPRRDRANRRAAIHVRVKRWARRSICDSVSAMPSEVGLSIVYRSSSKILRRARSGVGRAQICAPWQRSCLPIRAGGGVICSAASIASRALALGPPRRESIPSTRPCICASLLPWLRRRCGQPMNNDPGHSMQTPWRRCATT
jgi:hypothetical protein